ncbi:metallophosphoesterase [Methanobacterium sp.]|uniref:metallophosphoesterase n=1 Tax=Methanobacterium sp. TaxID=2164 RepID=UPI003C723B13
MDSKNIIGSLLSLKTDIPFSDKIGDPVVINSKGSLNLIFNEELDLETVSDGIKLFKITSDNTEIEEDIIVDKIGNSLKAFNLSRSDNSKFTEGEEYKLSINNIRSLGGASLEEDYINYFAIDYSFNLDSDGISDLNNKRSLVVCISDIHLGANDSYSEITKNREALVNFLNQIRASPNIKELVIIGDLIDEWFIPMNLDTFNGKTQRDFVKSVAFNNKPVIDAFNNIIQDNNVKVTYVPGNHDILIDYDDIESIMPGVNQARDVRGLGFYTPEDIPETVIEHGHRYNFYCAPDPSNRHITKTDSILPPGYFFTRMATSSVIQGRPKRDEDLPVVTKNELGMDQYRYFLYWNVWKGLVTDFPVHEELNEKVITTDIDGFTDSYAINDFLPYQETEDDLIKVNLFEGIIENWDERQDINLVPVNIPIEDAVLRGAFASFLDDQSAIQFFNNPVSDKRIVIFGHSHEARIITSLNDKQEKNIYVNSGTWIDKNKCTMTFVVIIPQKSNESAPSYVNLYQYSPSGDIKKLESQAITNIK